MEDSTYEKNVFVQAADCVVRAQCFTNVSYDVKLNLPRGDWFSGCVDIKLNLKKAPTTDLFFDFRGIKIAEYVINGQPVAEDPSVFKNHHVKIPTSMLRVGDEVNTVKIYFMNKYRKDGVGLHSFTDKTDG